MGETSVLMDLLVFKRISGRSRKDRQQSSKSDNPDCEKCHKENIEQQFNGTDD